MYQIIIAPVISAAIAQLLKPLIKSNGLSWSWHSLVSYSGMPSSHAAMAASLAASVGLTQGADSPLFAVTLIFGFFIIRDALGVRNYVGRNGKILNRLIYDLKIKNRVLTDTYPRSAENVGHTPAQIFIGACLGVMVSAAFYYGI